MNQSMTVCERDCLAAYDMCLVVSRWASGIDILTGSLPCLSHGGGENGPPSPVWAECRPFLLRGRVSLRSRRNKTNWETAMSEMDIFVFFSWSVPAMAVSYEQNKYV